MSENVGIQLTFRVNGKATSVTDLNITNAPLALAELYERKLLKLQEEVLNDVKNLPK